MSTQTFEIPSEMRTLAEKSVEEARKAFEGFIEATQTARSNLEGATDKLRASTRDAQSKAVNFAEENVRAAFDHAEKLVQAKDSEEILSLQVEFVRRQMAHYQQQITELGANVQGFGKQHR